MQARFQEGVTVAAININRAELEHILTRRPDGYVPKQVREQGYPPGRRFYSIIGCGASQDHFDNGVHPGLFATRLRIQMDCSHQLPPGATLSTPAPRRRTR